MALKLDISKAYGMPTKSYAEDGVQCKVNDYNDEMCLHNVLFCSN